MQIRKGCYLCQQRLGIYSCKKCARPVCEIDYNKKYGLCNPCMMKDKLKW